MLNLYIEKGNCAIAFEMYKDFKRVHSDDLYMLQLAFSFQRKKCVCLIDTTKQKDQGII